MFNLLISKLNIDTLSFNFDIYILEHLKNLQMLLSSVLLYTTILLYIIFKLYYLLKNIFMTNF